MSNSNLEKIQARITETQEQISSLNSGTLDDVKDRAKKRAALTEELHLLFKAEEDERARLQQEAAEKQAKDRKAVLSDFDHGIAASRAEEERQREAVTKSLNSLIAAVVALDEVWRPDAFNIPSGVLSRAERYEIKAAIETEADRVTLTLCGALRSLTRDTPASVKLKLENLFGAPVDGVKQSVILETVRNLARPRSNVTELKQKPAERSNEKPATGLYQSVNLRPPERGERDNTPQPDDFVGGYYPEGGGDAA